VPFEEGIRRTAEWFREATEEGLFDDDTTTTNATSTGLTERDRSCSLLSVISEESNGEDTNGRNSPTTTTGECLIFYSGVALFLLS